MRKKYFSLEKQFRLMYWVLNHCCIIHGSACFSLTSKGELTLDSGAACCLNMLACAFKVALCLRVWEIRKLIWQWLLSYEKLSLALLEGFILKMKELCEKCRPSKMNCKIVGSRKMLKLYVWCVWVITYDSLQWIPQKL